MHVATYLFFFYNCQRPQRLPKSFPNELVCAEENISSQEHSDAVSDSAGRHTGTWTYISQTCSRALGSQPAAERWEFVRRSAAWHHSPAIFTSCCLWQMSLATNTHTHAQAHTHTCAHKADFCRTVWICYKSWVTAAPPNLPHPPPSQSLSSPSVFFHRYCLHVIFFSSSRFPRPTASNLGSISTSLHLNVLDRSGEKGVKKSIHAWFRSLALKTEITSRRVFIFLCWS